MAVVLDSLFERKADVPSRAFTEDLDSKWGSIRIRTLPVEEGRKSPSACEPNPSATEKMDEGNTCNISDDLLIAKHFVSNVNLTPFVRP